MRAVPVIFAATSSVAACFPSLPPEDDAADTATTGADTAGSDTTAATDTSNDTATGLDAGDDVVANDTSADIATNRWIRNLPAEVSTAWGRAGTFQPQLADGGASPTLRFTRTSSTCAFDVAVAGTTGQTSWTCPAEVARCAVGIEARDGERRETGELTLLCTNSLPVVTDVLIEPAAAFPGETLTCKYSFADADGDEDKSSIAWFIGNDPVGEGPTITAPFQPTKAIRCEVTGHDGVEDANTVSASGRILGFVEVAGGSTNSCARADDDSLWCWGLNNIGQLGRPGFEDATRPRFVNMPSGVNDLSVGAASGCATVTTGNLLCWGYSPDGLIEGLDDPTTEFAWVQPTLMDISDVGAVTLGALFGCVLRNDAKAWCWGNNVDGVLGRGNLDSSAAPIEVPNLTQVTQLAAGLDHMCAVSNGRVYCWGSNRSGQLGQGDTTPQNARTLVNGPSNVDRIAVGGQSTCARNSDGWACWGRNAFRQLGLAEPAASETNVLVPTHAAKFVSISELTVGDTHACGIDGDGSAKCLGSGFDGRLGHDSEGNSSELVDVVGMPGAVSRISVGRAHTCAISEGWAYCWGDNNFGQLGVGDRFDRDTATPVATPVR